MTFSQVRERIARVARVPIALKQTPLHEAPNLAKALRGPRIFVKRDDLTGVAMGGNKLRNLEFRLARTMAEKPDVVIVGLDLQSNSARQTVGACNKLGLETILVLEGKGPDVVQGNLLVDYLLGAEIHFAASRDEQRRLLDSLAERCRGQGKRPHILNDNPMFDVGSALAYLETSMEMIEQLDALHLKPSCFYMSSSGKGQAGIVLAQRLLGVDFAMHGVTATREFDVRARSAEIANKTLQVLGLDPAVTDEDIVSFDDFVGPGYGVPSEAGNEAVRLFARTEGIVLDPVYTGKCAAGMIRHIREGRFKPDDVVVFVHTGGVPAIFTWNELWTGKAAAPSAATA